MDRTKINLPSEARLSSQGSRNEGEWVVMFVDIEGSTRLKYLELDQAAAGITANKWKFSEIVLDLLKTIKEEATFSKSTKFTGDGAMIVFKRNEGGCSAALRAAARIIQAVDRGNFESDGRPHIHVRIGIATGPCVDVSGVGVPELSGRPADLAARLCSEADRDGVLIDDATKRGVVGLPPNHFRECNRRLTLKGVPLKPKPDPGPFWHYQIERLVQAAESDYSSNGLVAVYLDRVALDKDFPHGLKTWTNRAVPKSSILVAGRTLISWADKRQLLLSSKKELKFYFLLSLPQSWKPLDEEEKRVVRVDYENALQKFQELERSNKTRFHVAHTEQLILDGVTFARIIFPGGTKHQPNGRLVALQDVNVFRPSGNSGKKDANKRQAKVTLFWVCTCGQPDSKGGASCAAHGLLRRTLQFWPKSQKPELFA